MVFRIAGKVALITGAASGMGLSHAKELLRNNLKGVTLTDINETNGKKALEEIETEFGKGKAIFIQCDVTKMEEIQIAFESTLEKFGSIDILINNAGILDDLNWEREIAINLNGTINGILLGFERYLKNYKQGEEAVILNTASLAGIVQYGVAPIYSGTKSAIIGLTRSWAHPMHYQRTKVRVMAIVPGRTRTTSFELRDFLLDPVYMDMFQKREQRKLQRPEFVSNELIKILENGRNGSLWVIEKEEPAYEFLVPTKEELKRHHINC
nr:15-hydroxyprostaglandin dehydrogenase [NAD(+)]-like [Leptinotarsa decemlineata]